MRSVNCGIFVVWLCMLVIPARADIASVQYVQSIVSSIGETGASVQANWNQTDSEASDYIKNKPTIPTTAAEVNAVPTTRTVNGVALSTDVTLTGADVAIAGYVKPDSSGAIEATDTINVAIGKLEKALDGVQSAGDYVSVTRTVNGHALSADVTVTKADVGLSNVANVDTTDATNITTGTMDVARLPVGTTSTTVAAGDDVRFDTLSTTTPTGTPPTGRVFVWFN